eukprot:Em1118g1a
MATQDTVMKNHMCLGSFTCTSRNDKTESVRKHIGHGVQLTYTGGELFVDCLSEYAIFIQSNTMARSQCLPTSSVMKLPPGGSTKVFSNMEFAKLFHETVDKGRMGQALMSWRQENGALMSRRQGDGALMSRRQENGALMSMRQGDGALMSRRQEDVGDLVPWGVPQERTLPSLAIGQPMLAQDMRAFKTQWDRGTCVGRLSNRSYIVDIDDQLVRRNRKFLKPSVNKRQYLFTIHLGNPMVFHNRSPTPTSYCGGHQLCWDQQCDFSLQKNFQSNGKAESEVKIAKKLWKRSKYPYLALELLGHLAEDPVKPHQRPVHLDLKPARCAVDGPVDGILVPSPLMKLKYTQQALSLANSILLITFVLPPGGSFITDEAVNKQFTTSIGELDAVSYVLAD